MLNKKNILIRIDSSSKIGLGHLMRTLILADGLKKDFNIIFLTRDLKGNQNFLIQNHGFYNHTVFTHDCFYKDAKQFLPTLIIIDNYAVTPDCEKQLQKICDVLVFDDEFKVHFANIVLNHSCIASKYDYNYLHHTKILAGAKYTLLKNSFFMRNNNFTPLNTLNNKKILITLGGSDPLNLSMSIKKYLLNLKKRLHINIVTTTANKKLKYLKNTDKELIIDEQNMAKLISSYDLIITSASTSMLEIIALHKPFIAIRCASNQTKTVDILLKQNLKNVIRNFSYGSLDRALHFVRYNPVKIKRVLQKYKFYKNGVAKWIINEYK